jgi:hypothetical protein
MTLLQPRVAEARGASFRDLLGFQNTTWIEGESGDLLRRNNLASSGKFVALDFPDHFAIGIPLLNGCPNWRGHS